MAELEQSDGQQGGWDDTPTEWRVVHIPRMEVVDGIAITLDVVI